ncbi:MAG TPA: transglycosylase SLT domain-containing protein [Burkholderiales bacterium]|nr:transglycosylase SLT domain-containing protein [Burkholderiales bacterium]
MNFRAAPSCLLLAVALLAPAAAMAGAQQYEPLADAVRATLSAAVGDRPPPTLMFGRQEDAQRWLSEMSQRLAKQVPDRLMRLELLRTVQYEATRAGLDPQLVLGVIDVESGFRKYAISQAGARGYMQVMPFWIKLIGRPHDNLFHLRINLRYGCVILRYYLDREKGDYFRALGRYNGSLGQADYPSRVIAAWKKRWHYDGPKN